MGHRLIGFATLLGASLVIATPALGAPPRADRDGDRVADRLERRLARLPADGRVNVIVSLSAPVTVVQ